MTATTSTMPGGGTVSIAGGPPYNCLTTKITTPWKGVWVAELDVDPGPDATTTIPTSGSATLTVGGVTLQGTIDPLFSARFVASVGLRLVAGAGGWDSTVAAQDFTNDGGVLSSTVEQQTAQLVGEIVVDNAPITLATKWTRASGPASRVFEDPDRDWYVDTSGVTQVASRPAATPDPSLQVLDFDRLGQRVEVSCSAIVLPGTTLTDSRFDGTLTIRKVEQTFTRDGARATCWCSSVAVDPLLAALVSMVRELAGVATLRAIPYRFVNAAGGGRLNLQAVDQTQGQPDLEAVPVMGGMPGDAATFANSTNVLVLFIEGQKGKPAAFAYDATVPLTRTIDASTAVHVGPNAASVELAGGQAPLVTYDPYSRLLVALATLASSLGSAATIANVAAAGNALSLALAGLPPAATTKVTAA